MNKLRSIPLWLLAWLLLALPAQAAIYAVTANGTTVKIPTLAAAVGASYAGTTIHITSAYTTDTLTLPADRAFVIDPDGSISVNAGQTLTVDSNTAGLERVGGAGSLVVGSWLGMLPGDIDGRLFGIVGDYAGGTGTDNTARIQLATNYAIAHQKNFKLPGGKILTSEVSIPVDTVGGVDVSHSGFKVYGEGISITYRVANTEGAIPGTTLINKNSTGSIFKVSGGVLFKGRAIHIENMNLYSASTDYAISLTGAPDRTTVDNVTIVADKGILFNDMWTNCEINKVFAQSITAKGAGTFGITITNETTAGGLLSINNSTVSGYDRGFHVGKLTSGDKTTSTVSIVSSQAATCNYGVYAYAAANLSIDRSHFESCSTATVNVEGGIKGLRIVGTKLYASTTGAGVKLNASSTAVVTGLEISGSRFSIIAAGGYGVLLNDSSYVYGTIANCMFDDLNGATHLGGYGIYASTGTPSNVTVTRNSYDMIDTAHNFYPAIGFGLHLEGAKITIGPGSQFVVNGVISTGTPTSATVSFRQAIPNTSSVCTLTGGGAQNISSLSPTMTGTTVDVPFGTTITLLVQTAGNSFLHNNATYETGRFMLKSGANYTVTSNNYIIQFIYLPHEDGTSGRTMWKEI